MIQFYAPDIETTGCLPEEESGHAVRVLRMEPGRRIRVVDGRGGCFECEITSARPKCVQLRIVETVRPPKPWQGRITLAVAPTKNFDRMEWLMEKAVELGIDRFVPVVCRHSERRVVKTDRLRRIAVSAMNQSLKTELPQIDEAMPLADFLREPHAGECFMGYCSDEVERRLLAPTYTPGADATILIGPEGDFSPEEVRQALDAGFIPVSMGEQRLRTETAALIGVATIHIANQIADSRGAASPQK